MKNVVNKSRKHKPFESCDFMYKILGYESTQLFTQFFHLAFHTIYLALVFTILHNAGGSVGRRWWFGGGRWHGPWLVGGWALACRRVGVGGSVGGRWRVGGWTSAGRQAGVGVSVGGRCRAGG